MIHKTVHHLSRGVLLTLEVAGVLALLAVLAWGGLLWRLSQGPIDLTGVLTDRVERALNEQQSDFIVDIGSSQLTWGGKRRPVELQINRVQVTRPDKTPVLAVGRIWIELSRRRLMIGQIVPKTIRIHGPALRVIRWADGQTTLNLIEGQDPPPADETAPKQGVLEALLAKLEEDRLPFLGGLERVLITNAVVFYDDKAVALSARARQTDLSFNRDGNGLALEISGFLDMGDGAKRADFAARARHDARSKTASALLTFRALNLSRLVQGEGPFKPAAQMDLPISGSLAVALDAALKPTAARFTVSSGAGRVAVPGLYKSQMGLRALSAAGFIDLQKWSGKLERLTVALGGRNGPVAAATALAYRDPQGARRADLSAALSGMPLDALKDWWPEALAPDARAWVTGHLSAGVADRATVEAGFLVPEDAPAKPDTLGGKIDFTGVKVDYFPPLPAVTGVDGRATYDLSSFTLDLKGGRMEDMSVGASKILIKGLNHTEGEHADIDIALSLSGPLTTALKTLDAKPLSFAKDLGLDTQGVAGKAAIDLGFRFPLHHGLELRDVKATAKARVTDALMPRVAAGLSLTGGPIDVTFDENKTLRVAGDGRLGDAALTFAWSRGFGKDKDAASRVEAKGALTPGLLAAFGAPEDLRLQGTGAAEATYTQTPDKSGRLTLRADLSSPALALPALNYTKPAGVKATLHLDLDVEKGAPRRATAFRFTAEGASPASVSGTAEFSNGGFAAAAIDRLLLGQNDLALKVTEGKGGFLSLHVTGKQADLSSVLSGGDTPSRENAAPVRPLSVSLSVARALGANGKTLENPRLKLERDAKARIDRLELDATAGQAPLSLRYLPAIGGHALDFRSDDAGAALSALGFTKSVRGGRVVITGRPNPASGPRDLAGSATLSDFTMSDAPALARLLNAISLPGILDLLDGKGIGFSRARVNFTWTDRDPPATPQKVRVLTLRDGETAGASLGLTFGGVIDERKKIYDLSGTIIPVSDVNKMLSSIPLVGEILSGGGNNIFAATYTMNGPKADPTVTVNPLSVLTPGILRKLFFQK